MSKDSNIRSYTAIDIEKYHKGLFSPEEMHDLEKAALDDPFLADALEGYAVPGINVTADIADLKKRLSDKTGENRKVIPLAAPPRSSFPWFRAAAMLILVIGAAFLVYQFGFNKDSSPRDVAQNKPAPAKDSDQSSQYLMPDSQKEIVSSLKQTTDSSTSSSAKAKDYFLNKSAEGEAKPLTVQKAISDSPDPDTVYAFTDDIYKKKIDKTTVLPPPPVNEESKYEPLEKKLADQEVLRRQNPNQFGVPTVQQPVKDAKAEQLELEAVGKQNARDSAIANQGLVRDMEAAASNRGNALAKQSNAIAGEKYKNANRINIFRGQVIDEDKNVVPFANITNRADNVGTYTDAKGNFTLTSPDSVLNVQIRSLGYENNNSQLNNTSLSNQVIMQEDRSLKEIVVSRKKVNSTRSRTSTMVLEEPEPVDGWTNYDAYLANNLNVPETWRSKQNEGEGSVTLSFEVDSKGQPVNITVDKSLCESCDKEAIRLIKQGPKWKRKSKKGRTSVTISF